MRSTHLSGPKHHRPHTHKEKALINNMGKGVGNRSVNCQFCAYPNSNYHKPNLVDFTVAKNPPEVIFNHRIENRKDCHHSTYSDQYFCTWKQPGQHANSTFCGESTKPDRTCVGGFRITIL